jgi:excisionase family DNA binding protein|tara:strand:+ start:937 stop:1173 length:237 start_codon:yes stop_codon:yes gene_type:complete
MTDEKCYICDEHTLMSPREAAKYLDVGRATIYRWMNGVEKDGKVIYLTAVYYGLNQIRISKQDLDKFKFDYKEATHAN